MKAACDEYASKYFNQFGRKDVFGLSAGVTLGATLDMAYEVSMNARNEIGSNFFESPFGVKSRSITFNLQGHIDSTPIN